MQRAAAFRNVTRGTAQLAVLAVVAAIGVGVGRWALPAGRAEDSARVVYIRAVGPGFSEDVVARKLAQMDAADNRRGAAVAAAVAAPVEPRAGSLTKRKLAQMDAADARVSPLARERTVIERKLAQMDAEDGR